MLALLCKGTLHSGGKVCGQSLLISLTHEFAKLQVTWFTCIHVLYFLARGFHEVLALCGSANN